MSLFLGKRKPWKPCNAEVHFNDLSIGYFSIKNTTELGIPSKTRIGWYFVLSKGFWVSSIYNIFWFSHGPDLAGMLHSFPWGSTSYSINSIFTFLFLIQKIQVMENGFIFAIPTTNILLVYNLAWGKIPYDTPEYVAGCIQGGWPRGLSGCITWDWPSRWPRRTLPGRTVDGQCLTWCICSWSGTHFAKFGCMAKF